MYLPEIKLMLVGGPAFTQQVLARRIPTGLWTWEQCTAFTMSPSGTEEQDVVVIKMEYIKRKFGESLDLLVEVYYVSK